MTPVMLGPQDHDEAVDFLNLVFSETSPHDLERLLPLCYRPEDMHHNWAIREGGRIRAIVGMFPRDWQVGAHTLRLAGIGGVSTHPRARGHGHMRALMERCLRQMAEEDFDLSWLAGRRQRYAWFGYEVCGLSWRSQLWPGVFSPREPVELRPLGSRDSDWLDACWALHEALPLRHPRPREDLHSYLISWRHQPHVALRSGRVVGYLVWSPAREQVTELVAEPGMALPILHAWLEALGKAVTLLHAPLPSGELHEIGAVAAGQQAYATGNWRIFRWERVLRALFSVRPQVGPVLPGRCVLGIEGQGAFQLECDGHTFQVEPRPLSEAQLRCEPALAMRLLLGPARPSAVLALPAALAVLDQWCPLPAYWARQDGV